MTQKRRHPPNGRSTRAQTHWREADYLTRRSLLADVRDSRRFASGRLLDVGCGSKPYLEIFASRVESYIGVDPDKERSQADVVGDVLHLPFQTESCDTVLATQVLEHVIAPDQMLVEIKRILKPGGHLILTAPQYWRLHEVPNDYYRFTSYGLRYLVEASGLSPLFIRAQGTAWTLIGQAVCNALQGRRWWHRLIPLVNLAFLCAERLWPDTGDTLNHILVARK